MPKINEVVVRKLRSQREPDDAIELWETIWSRYQLGGSAGVKRFLDELLVHPDAVDDEGGEDSDEEDQ